MKNHIIIITLVIGTSIACAYAFDGYDADYSYKGAQQALSQNKALQDTITKKRARQALVSEQNAKRIIQLEDKPWLTGMHRDQKGRYFFTIPEDRTLRRQDDELSELCSQIENAQNQYNAQIPAIKKYHAQIYGLPGYEYSLTGELAGPVKTTRGMINNLRSWISRKWYR